VLFVCTGNICRSPLAERLGQQYVDAALGDQSVTVRLSSAGTHAVVASGMDPYSATVLRGHGGDPEGFRARRLMTEHVLSADLVLAMTREHRRAVLSLAPRALARTFTLLEAADLVRMTGELDLPAEGSALRSRALVAGMAAARSRRVGGAGDDVGDPIGRPLGVHQEVGDVIADALAEVFGRLVTPRAARLSS
jgi:protein-tyrosine phosphatase